jgi:pheromone shutdown protein TraB
MDTSVELYGTLHNSGESIERVEELIREREPETVAIELPPHMFEDEPEWSIEAALDPRSPVTLRGLLLKRQRSPDGIWRVDEMFVAAATAADIGATIALIDRPFAESMDEITTGLAADTVGWLHLIRTEIDTHRGSETGENWKSVAARDLRKFGEWSSPHVDFLQTLAQHGVTDPRDSEQMSSASQRMGPEGAVKQIEVVRQHLPSFMQTHIDERDACMAGHLRWLAENRDGDVLAFMAKGHVPGVSERVSGERDLEESLIRKPRFADPAAIPEGPPTDGE